MLRLHRITDEYEFMKDTVTGQVIMPGDFYYQDDEDPTIIVNAKTLHDLKMKKKKDNWDYSDLNDAKSRKEYEQQLKQAEYELRKETILENKIWGHEASNYEKDEGIFY